MSTASSAERPRPGARHRASVVAAAVVCVILGAALQLWGAVPAGASPSMQVTGSSFASKAIESWVGQASTLDGLSVNWQVSSSVVGLNNFGQNQDDFVASDIPYSAQQSTYYPNQPYQYLPDVAGGLSFMYNLNGNTGSRITGLVLDPSLIAKIFLGEITKWNDPAIVALQPPDVQPNLPDTTIVPVFRSDAAGENYLLSDYLLHEEPANFTAAQTAFRSANPGSPSASWPQPASGSQYDPSTYPAWAAGTPVGLPGSDGVANSVAAESSLGAITYVETAYAKLHFFPVASLVNASGAAVQPTSVDVATALEAAQLHADLTQDLTNVYTNPLPAAYPLSAYSYLVTPCSPSLAAAQQFSCDGSGGSSPFSAAKGQALGQFVSYMACAGQYQMPVLGYSPLPPVLVKEDFAAIGRMNGGVEPPSPTAANCKNPYVDGDTVLPGSPVVAGVVGGGVSPTAVGASPAPGPATAAAGGAGPGHSGIGGTGSSGSGGSGSGSGSGGSGSRAVASGNRATAGLTAAQIAHGLTVVNGRVVQKLGAGGESQFVRADGLLAATKGVASPRTAEYIAWVLAALALILGPPLLAGAWRRRVTAATDGADGADGNDSGEAGDAAGRTFRADALSAASSEEDR